MSDRLDVISIQGLVCECEIGIRQTEKGVLQKLVVNFDAEIDPIPSGNRDDENSIKVDYSTVAAQIQKMLLEKKFNLIETAAEEISTHLLTRFPIHSAHVTVFKFPKDMPDVSSVSYSCRRLRSV